MTQHRLPARRVSRLSKVLAAGLLPGLLLSNAAGSSALAQGAAMQGGTGQGGTGGALPGLLPPPAETSTPGTANPLLPGPGAAQDKRSQRGMERRIQDWHDRLRITPAQEPQWSAFATAMRENMQRMQAMQSQRRQGAATATALEDIRTYARDTQAHAADVQRLVGPFEALYNSLSPEQRQAADQAFRRFEERGGRNRRRLG